MKKLENPKWEDCRDYLRNTILPRLQEIQRDTFGNEKLYFGVAVGTNGEYISVHASSKTGDKDKGFPYLIISCVESREEIAKKYNDLAEFIKEHSA